MKVFISWSGEKTQAAANVLGDWLPRILPGVEPWISSEDIRKGSAWFSRLADGLQQATFGIICLDRSNVDAPWVLFEAGALANAISGGRVAPLLFAIKPSDVSGPFAQFQMTMFQKEDMRRLILSLAEKTGNVKTTRDTNAVFERHWPALEKAILRISFPKTSVSSGKKAPANSRVSSQERDVLRFIVQRRNELEPAPEPSEVAEECQVSVTKADHLLDRLRARGFVRIDAGRWCLTEAGTDYVAKSDLDS